MTRDPYAVCLRIAREHYENFPVASILIPKPMRRHVAAVYAFARAADDFADEGDRAPHERHALLNDWAHRLRVAAAGSAEDDGTDEAAIFAALEQTLASQNLPTELFSDLLSAFHQDVDTHRYATWTDLLDYCRRSANPVGRIVLRLARRDDAALDASSDALCTALQLTNFWQDVERDWRKGRVYLPADLLAAHGADERSIGAREMNAPLRAALEDASARTRNLFEWGRFVCERVGGRLGFQLRATWLGGTRILDRLEQSRFDVFRHRPTLGASDIAPLAARLAWWSASARSGMEPTAERRRNEVEPGRVQGAPPARQ